jgi:hypothetical protein
VSRFVIQKQKKSHRFYAQKNTDLGKGEDDFYQRIVTGDKNWVFHYNLS